MPGRSLLGAVAAIMLLATLPGCAVSAPPRTGPLLACAQRVGFQGSELVWQYYAGQGIQLQMLANFGRANALWSARRRSKLAGLLGELAPLASDRGGFPAWEYFFQFGGGKPPWTIGAEVWLALSRRWKDLSVMRTSSLK